MMICYPVTVSSVYSESSNTTEIHLKMLTQAKWMWMADSQSSWGRYWFAEDKKDKSISEWDCGEGMNTPREAGENVNTTQQAPVLPKGKKNSLYLKTSRLKTKQRILLWRRPPLTLSDILELNLP